MVFQQDQFKQNSLISFVTREIAMVKTFWELKFFLYKNFKIQEKEVGTNFALLSQ